MRKSRLYQVICFLLEKGETTAADMALEFDVSVRTIYRDVEALSAAGIPIYAETGRHGGICLMKGFVLERALLTPEERGDILTAVKSYKQDLEKVDAAALHKVAALFDLPPEDWLEIDCSGPVAGSRAGEKFRCFQRAVIQHRCVELAYTNPDGAIVPLSVRPLKLAFCSGGWYVKAVCQEECRMLRLSHIVKWKATPETFTPQAFPEEPPASPQEPLTQVVLRFPKELACRVYDKFDSSLVAQKRDGTLELKQELPVDDRLIGFLLSLGPQAKVAAPAALREELARLAKEIYENNKP